MTVSGPPEPAILAPMSTDSRDPRGIVVTCARCDRPAPIDPEKLRGPTFDPGDETPNDPSLPVVIVPPDGWIGDPDSDGIVCGDCATSEEIVQWIADGETVERGLRDEDD